MLLRASLWSRKLIHLTLFSSLFTVYIPPFFFLQAVIGFRGTLKAARGLAISVVVTGAILGLFALITVAWYTQRLDSYDALGYLTTVGQASLAMEWLLFIFWVAVIGLGSARVFILFKKFSN